jgi:hypothetical protein
MTLFQIYEAFCSHVNLGLQLLYSCIYNHSVDHITGQILGPQQRMIVSIRIERKSLITSLIT